MGAVSLQNLSSFTLLESPTKVKNLAENAKKKGYSAIALTDINITYGLVDFYKAAKEIGIKPIIGCEVYVAPGSRFDRETVSGEDRYYHLVLLAENNTGYANLMKIVSKGFTEGYY